MQAAVVVLGPERFGEGQHEGLGRPVNAHEGSRLERDRRRDVEDGAPMQEQRGHEQARQLGQRHHVDLELPAQVLQGFGFEGPVVAEAGVVHQCVHLKSETRHVVVQPLRGIRPRQVARHHGGDTAGTPDCLCHLVQPLRRPRRQHHMCAACGHRTGQGLANAGRGAGDDGNPLRLSHGHVFKLPDSCDAWWAVAVVDRGGGSRWWMGKGAHRFSSRHHAPSLRRASAARQTGRVEGGSIDEPG